jgi:hypothetical protein
LIEQGAEDDDVYFILSGTFRIVANARLLAMRGPGVGRVRATPSVSNSAYLSVVLGARVQYYWSDEKRILGYQVIQWV